MTPKQYTKKLQKIADLIDIDELMNDLDDLIEVLDKKIAPLEEKDSLSDKQQEKLDTLNERRSFLDCTLRDHLDQLLSSRDEIFDAINDIDEWD